MDKLSAIVYICLASIIIWVFLKSFGVINTPTLIELLPILAGAIGGGAAYGKFTTSLKHIEDKTKQISPMKDRLTKIETTCKMNHSKK